MKPQDHKQGKSEELEANPFISKLREQLLSILSESDKLKESDEPNAFFLRLIESIRDVSECDVCSLWRINFPKELDNTSESNDKRHRFRFVSLIARALKYGLKDENNNDVQYLLAKKPSYVHKYSPSFTEEMLSSLEKIFGETYCFLYGNKLEECLKKFEESESTCHNFVKTYGIQYVVGIPVKNLKDGQIIALLRLYFGNYPFDYPGKFLSLRFFYFPQSFQVYWHISVSRQMFEFFPYKPCPDT